MVTRSLVEDILETYSLDEILELNDLTEYDVLYYLVEQGQVELPNPRPVNIE